MKLAYHFSLALLVLLEVACKGGEDQSNSKPAEEATSTACKWGEFERRPLINRVAAGDGDAAYKLADHYLFVEDIPEAGLFWLKKARELGNPDADPIVIKSLEETIVSHHD